MATTAIQAFDARVASVSETRLSKSDVNNLIMDYLITEGYPSAAEKFATEANIEREPDHSSIEQRVQIRESIHRGDLQQAIELINDLNPELLDNDNKLHFSLLRLQLVELIRASFTSATPNSLAVRQAIEFAQQNLAPYAPLDPAFKNDLERAMALLIVPRDSWTAQTTPQQGTTAANDFGALAELVDPSLRRKVAKDVNEAILQSQGEKREANIRELVRARAWTEQRARQQKKFELPPRLGLGLDGDDTEETGNGTNGHDTEMAENGASADPAESSGRSGSTREDFATRYMQANAPAT